MDWSKFNQSQNIVKALRANPKLGLAAISAGLVAPSVISNDDRGYFSSSVLTTPLVAAAFMAAPKVSSVAKAEAKQAKSYFKPSLSKIETKIPKTYSEITNLQKEFTGGNIRTSVFNKSLSQFYASGAKESIQDMSVNQLRVRLYGDPTGVNMASRTRYLENVVHAESLKHLPTAELVNYNRQLVAPSIGLNGVRDMVEKQIANGNAPFVRAMNFHMQKMEGMKYSGFAGIAKTADEVFMSTDVVKPKTLFNSWNDAKGALSTQRPDLFAAINKQIESGAIDLESFSVVRSNSALNPIIGLKLGDLNVPVVGNHGRILGGKDWSSTGVSRGVFVGKRKMLSDVYAVEHIGHGAVKIEKELSAINIISGVDNLDTWDNGARNIAAASDLQASLISKKYVGSNLLGFGQDGTKGYDAQTSREMETTVEHLESAGLMKAGSEKMGRVFEDREMARASYAGMQNPSRQNQYIRAFTKDTTLTNIKSTYKNRPYMMSDMFGELAGDAGVPVVGVTEGGVSAAQRTFFSQLPSTVEELHTYENEAIKILQNRHGLEERQARGSWKHLSEWLAKDDNLAVMRKSEALGEGSKIAVRNGMNITRTRNFSVTEHALGDNPVIGSTLSPKDILGFSGGHPISADAKTNVLKQFTTNDDGTFTLTVDENQKFGKGAKIDLFTRGLVGEDLSREEGKVFANGLSRYNIATGSGPAISSENTIFGLIGSEAAKGDPVDTTLKLAAGTIREMADMDQPVLVDKYTKLLGERGIDIAKGTFDSSSFPGLTNIQSRGEFSKTRKIVEDLMTEAGDRIRDLAISQPHKLNETGRNFAATSRSSSFGNLEEFLLTSKAYGDMTAWDHTAFNAPKKVGITYDIFQDLSVSGHHGAIKDIKSRLEYDGDAAMTRDVASFMSGEDTIPTRMSMRDALGTKTRNIKLHTAEGRIGSIFDMDHPQAKSNFIVDLPDGSSLPVLGHDAYGGRSNRFGAGEFSATDRERSLLDVFKAHEKGGTPAELTAARDLYLKGNTERAGLEDVLTGKQSFLRTPTVDPLGAGGFMQSRNSSLKLASGEINPFEVKVNIDYVRRLKDKKLTEALLNGESATAALARYPVSSVPLVSIKLDKSLKKNEFGIDEGLTPMIRGDFDKDSVYLYPFERGSEGEADAMKAIAEGSEQHSSLAELRSQETEMFSELARNEGIKPKSLKDRLSRAAKSGIGREGFLEEFTNTGEVLKRRLVSRTIGEYSNTRSVMMDLLEQSSTVTNQAERDSIRHLFFNPYQSPISAAKGKAGSKITYSGARDLNNRLVDSLDGSFGEFKKSFMNVLQFAPDSVIQKANESGDLLERLHSGFDPNVIRASKAKVASLESAFAKADIKGSLMASDMIPYLSGSRTASREAATGANMAAEGLGAINEGVSQVVNRNTVEEVVTSAKRVGKAFESSGAKQILGIGLAAAAVAGIFTTSTSSPRAKSANRYRPEERSSTSGAIPGEAPQGMHSSNPPRTQVSSQTPNVNRGYVVPIQQSSDVEVNMKSDDPSRATEAAKMVARSAGGGQSTVTTNYKNSNLTSLRNKQKLRERLDES